MSAEKRNVPSQPKTNVVTTRRISKTVSKSDRFLRYAKHFFAQFGTAILAVAIVAYVFLQLMLNVGTMLDYEHAAYTTVTDKEELEAFLFRDEHPIVSTADGTDCYLAEDGEKVRLGEDIAITYSNPNDVAIQQRIEEIDKRIDVLEQSSLSTSASTTNLSAIDSQINQLVLSIVRQADTNDLDKILRRKEELLILMNRRQAIVQSDSYASEIIALSKERESLNRSLSGASFKTQAPESGYFYSTVDGYENSFTIEKLEALTVEDFDTLSQTTPDPSIIENSSGKIVVSSTWYIAVSVTKRAAERFRNGTAYPIVFQYSNNTELNMTLERRIIRSDKDTTILIFSTKQMPEGFDYARCQTVELPYEEHEGLRISTSALRMKDGKTGVYVIVGTKVVFKETTVLYNYGSYSVCAIPKNHVYPNKHDVAYSSKTELSLHDAVVTDGNDIYDGMRLT